MDVGEVRSVTTGACEGLHLVETGMYDVTGYGGVYLLDGETVAIVETGTGRSHEHILAALGAIDRSPSDVDGIVVTHVHLDHAGGAGFLAEACPNAAVYVHEIGAPHLVDPAALVAGTKRAVGDQWAYYADPHPVPADRVVPVGDGEAFTAGGREFVAHHAPGHAPHQVILQLPAMDAVFTGDAAGIWVPDLRDVHPTSPPPQFDLDQAVADLDTIAACEPSTLLFTHFGEVAYEDELLSRYERTLAAWVRDVDEAYAELEDEETVVERLANDTDLASAWGERKAMAEIRVNVTGALRYLERIREEN